MTDSAQDIPQSPVRVKSSKTVKMDSSQNFPKSTSKRATTGKAKAVKVSDTTRTDGHTGTAAIDDTAISGRPSVQSPPFVSIVVPVKNESASIGPLIDALRLAHASGAEIIVVDDASTDGTGSHLAAAQFITVVRRERSVGFGAAVKSGFAVATGELVAWMPGNLRVHPLYAVAMAHELRQRAPRLDAFAKARRGNRVPIEQVTTFVAGIVLSLRARRPMMETGGTPTVVPRAALALLHGAPDDLGLESYTLWKLPQSGYRVIRLVTPFGERRYGQSHWNRGYGAKIKLLVHLLKTVHTYR